jgi:hypothetical protein
MSNLDYAGIKALSKELHRPIKTLIALAANNDPFYVVPRRRKAAQWFSKTWTRLELGDGSHVRRVHYIIVSQRTPLLNVYRRIYTNTHANWLGLVLACRDARSLDLVPRTAFVDRRNDEPIIYLPNNPEQAWIATFDQQPDVEIDSVEMPDLPALHLQPPTIQQRYHVEIWVEKTTMNDILLPIAQRFGCNLITGSGELSLTACELVVDRAIASGLPVRILYISDFDPAGMSMPVAASRKIEHRLRREGLDLDVQLRPIALTADQCVDFQLPRTPIKMSDRRASEWARRFGEGATELDALQALHPGALGRSISRFRS